jgi:triose/dihydroxyacetone kinase / FAD-AMP lyase (cyclizing)
MPGFSITLLLFPSPNDSSAPSSALLLSLLDEDTNAPGWKWSSKAPPSAITRAAPVSSSAVPRQAKRPSQLACLDPQEFTAAIERACKQLIAAEPQITYMDSIAGDGDCGLTLKAGASGAWHLLQRLLGGSGLPAGPINRWSMHHLSLRFNCGI